MAAATRIGDIILVLIMVVSVIAFRPMYMAVIVVMLMRVIVSVITLRTVHMLMVMVVAMVAMRAVYVAVIVRMPARGAAHQPRRIPATAARRHGGGQHQALFNPVRFLAHRIYKCLFLCRSIDI